MQNYTKTELGKLEQIINQENGKAFLKNALQLTGCEISVNTMPAGTKLPFNHKHKQMKKCIFFSKARAL